MNRGRSIVSTATLALGLAVLTVGCSDERATGPTSDVNLDARAGERSAVSDGLPASAQVPDDLPSRASELSEAQGMSVGAASVGAEAHAPVVRVYQDEQPWFGIGRARTTLVDGLGKTPGDDLFFHSLDELSNGVPSGTRVVIITSNSSGSSGQAARQNEPAAQAALSDFLATGGRLIVDMGDNLSSGGFIAPGATGTPDNIFPDPCADATLTSEGAGHPIASTLNNDNIDTQESCSVAHGNLEQGLTLPDDHTPLMTATFDGVDRTIMAEYCHNGGRVILDTNTKEFSGQHPAGQGPATVMTALFEYALSDASSCQETGSLQASATTSGANPDPDGYELSLDDGAQTATIGTNGTATFTGLTGGDHDVALLDIAPNCSVSGANPRTVSVTAGATTRTRFAVECARLVDIDPSSAVNQVSLQSSGLLYVAVLTSDQFDAREVDPTTATLGDGAGSDVPVADPLREPMQVKVTDVDGDGDADLLLGFEISDLVQTGDLTSSTRSLLLRGQTTGGDVLQGRDAVRPFVGRRGGGRGTGPGGGGGGRGG